MDKKRTLIHTGFLKGTKIHFIFVENKEQRQKNKDNEKLKTKN